MTSLLGISALPLIGFGLLLTGAGDAATAAQRDPWLRHASLIQPHAGAWHKPETPWLSSIKIVENSAAKQKSAPSNVSIEMITGGAVEVGSKVTFRVTAKRAGYLLLVDIDAGGKMSQIFPSPELLVQSDDTDINMMKPDDVLVLPTAAAAARGFQYLIAPPVGPAAVIAILSERRVQLLDLPDLPQRLDSEAEMLSYLAKWTNDLRIPDATSGKLDASNWWFDVKSYVIK